MFLKLLMALSGALFVFYVLLHMYGNLKLLWGEKPFNDYAHHLRTMFTPILPYGGLLWLLRALLVVAVIAHLYAAFALWARANHARPNRYVAAKAARTGLRTATMRWGGVAILLFLIWHLLQFTMVKFNVNSDVKVADDNPYQLVHASFQVWWVVLIYVLGMIALGLHLFHGVWSMAQTLGWTNTASARRTWKTVAVVIALVVAVGFVIPPIAIAAGA